MEITTEATWPKEPLMQRLSGENTTLQLLSSPENKTKERVGRDGAPTRPWEEMTMMAMGRDGAPTMTVRCPTGDNASGDHIVFNLQQRSFSSFSFHQKTTDAFTNLVTLGAKSKLMSLMVSVNNIDLESDEYVIEKQLSLSCFLIMSSLLHQATTGASLHYQATTGASLLHQATTGASLLHQATTGASLLHQASTGASLMQRIQVQNLLKQKLTERKFVERLVPSSSAFSLL
ncbi:hypothetical protein YC2023_099930 [Brassica napus]